MALEAVVKSLLLSPAALATGTLLLVAFFFNTYFQTRPRPIKGIPTVGEAGQRNFRVPIEEGYSKYPDRPFLLPTAHHKTVILPIKYVEEIKAISEAKLSFYREIKSRFLGEYTGLGQNLDHAMVHSVKIDLTRSIKETLDALQDEMAIAGAVNIGPCADWTPMVIHSKILPIVAMISGRVFVGAPLNRNPEWMSICINYTVDSLMGAMDLWRYPAWQRPFRAPFEPRIKAVRTQKRKATELMGPVITERVDAMKDPKFEKPADMIQWIIDNQPKENALNPAMQAQSQLNISLAAIHTTTMSVTHVLYDLAAYPEHLAPLREELEEVLAAGDGKLDKQNIVKLRKLDSFMKESQRFNPTALGTFIAVAANGVNRDARIWENPDKFDGFRFEKLRSQPGFEHKHQYVTTGTDSLNFGHGIHGCPGRFFASNEIKILLTYILLNYDFKFKDGNKRPENVYNETNVSPDPFVEMLFRSRERS